MRARSGAEDGGHGFAESSSPAWNYLGAGRPDIGRVRWRDNVIPMDFRQIRYALSVAKERIFTRAAPRLRISQSAVSEQVKLLEDEIGFPLFRREPD